MSDGSGDLLDGGIVLALDHLPHGLERHAERRRQLAHVFDLLVALRPAPAESNARLAVDREIVHLGDGQLCVSPANKLHKSTALAGRNLAVGNLAKVMEEALCEIAEKINMAAQTECAILGRTRNVSSLMQAGNPPTKTVVLFGSVAWFAALAFVPGLSGPDLVLKPGESGPEPAGEVTPLPKAVDER